MKKKFSLEIKTPCHENFNNMISNANGSFCNSCAKNVIDLSTKTNREVAQFIAEAKDKNICVRLNVSQLEQTFEYETHPKNNNFKYAVAVAASILVTSNSVAQDNKQPFTTVQTCEAKPPKHLLGKVAIQQQKTKVVTVKGYVLDKKTNKPISAENYPNLSIYAYGAAKSTSIDPKTGAYSLDVELHENTKIITIYISNNDFRYSKEFTINPKEKNKILPILVDPEKEFQALKIMGGMGVNYRTNKKNNPS
ncbi:hypothetical protein [Flavobacterium aciduliphilum]|uniref:Carboxypeptidase-like protein n=1 Tax=Flavobacterium aciduliphilum TaxID=1101402 RepID=A0A328YR75_9FLAO|nr:hypothetical protein [Flavobacterium aciduliphilum]RAR72586.1 hypothetical protein CLV55_105156 [Flavobacterium aciduliphilum]